jgi:hypothetical protein
LKQDYVFKKKKGNKNPSVGGLMDRSKLPQPESNRVGYSPSQKEKGKRYMT